MSYQLSNFNIFYIIIWSIFKSKLNIFYLNTLINFHITFLIFKKYFKCIYIFDVLLFSTSVYQYLSLYLFVNKILNFYLNFDIILKLKPFCVFYNFYFFSFDNFCDIFRKTFEILPLQSMHHIFTYLTKIFKSLVSHF